MSVYVFSILFYLGLKHRPFEALIAGVPTGRPAGSHPCAALARCRGIVTATITTTTPSSATAATMAIIAIDVVVISLTHLPRDGSIVPLKR